MMITMEVLITRIAILLFSILAITMTVTARIIIIIITLITYQQYG